MPAVVKPDPRIAQFTSVNSVMHNRGLRHAIHLERLKTGQVDKIAQFLSKDVMPDLMGQIEQRVAGVQTATTAKKIRRLKALSNSVSGTVRGAIGNVNKTLRKDLTDLGFTEANWQLGAIKDSMPIELTLTAPSAALMQSIVTTRPMRGRLLKSWMDELGKNASTEIMRQINIGLIEGESIPTMMRRLRGTAAALFKDGVAAKVARDASILTRTAVNNVVTQAREITYQANESVVKGVRYLSTLDARTTDICMGLDGKVFPVGEGERPPMHLQCRSTTVPVLKSWKEMGIPLKELKPGTRASMNGQVPGTLTYPKWLKQMDSNPATRHIVDEALGPGKAALWRRGKVPISKFTDTAHRSLTLRQLEKLEARTVARGRAITKSPKIGFPPPGPAKAISVSAPPPAISEQPTEGMIKAIKDRTASGGAARPLVPATHEERKAMFEWVNRGKVKGSLHRGVGFSDEQWSANFEKWTTEGAVLPRKAFGINQPVSYTTDAGRIGSMAGGDVAVFIEVESTAQGVLGRKIAKWSFFAEEQEVFVSALQEFKIVSAKFQKAGGIWKIKVRPIPPGTVVKPVIQPPSSGISSSIAGITDLRKDFSVRTFTLADGTRMNTVTRKGVPLTPEQKAFIKKRNATVKAAGGDIKAFRTTEVELNKLFPPVGEVRPIVKPKPVVVKPVVKPRVVKSGSNFDTLKEAETWARKNGAPIPPKDAKSVAKLMGELFANRSSWGGSFSEYMKTQVRAKGLNKLRLEAEENWLKLMRRRTITTSGKGSLIDLNEEIRLALQNAINDNHTNPVFSSIVKRQRLPVHVVYRKSQIGSQAQAEWMNGASHYYDVSLPNRLSVSLGRPKPGMISIGDQGIAGELRHEYAHGIFDRLTRKQQDLFLSKIPDSKIVAKDLTFYASEKPRQEVFTELFGIVTDRNYVKSDFPKWVQELGDLVLELSS